MTTRRVGMVRLMMVLLLRLVLVLLRDVQMLSILVAVVSRGWA